MLHALPRVRKEHAFIELSEEIYKEKLEDRNYGSKDISTTLKGILILHPLEPQKKWHGQVGRGVPR